MATDTLFEQIREEIPGAIAAAVGSVEAGKPFTAKAWGSVDPATVERPLRELLASWHAMYSGLGGAVDFGSNDEVLISASRGYVLARIHHDSGRFVAVFLSADGNVGYLRFRLRDYLRRAMSA